MAGERDHVSFGRFGETAMWILVALASGPKHPAGILDEVRALDGHVGPAAMLGAIARLERRGLVEPLVDEDRQRQYRLSGRSLVDQVIHRKGFAR